MLLTCLEAAQRCRSMEWDGVCNRKSILGKGASRWCSWFSFKQHLLLLWKCPIEWTLQRWKCLASRQLGLYWGEEDPIECLKVAACTVFFWYIMKCEGYFLTVCQKRSHWPKGGWKEVERQLRGLEACFKCCRADLCVWLNISCVAAGPCCITAVLCVNISWFLTMNSLADQLCTL